MGTLFYFLFEPGTALAWSLIDPNSTAIQTGVVKPNEIIGLLIKSASWIFTIIGAVALLVFIAGGVMWLVSAGNSQLVDKGKQAMIGAAIGMGVVFLSFTMTDFVLKTFGYNRYGEWSTLPQQADPRGIEGGTGMGTITADGSTGGIGTTGRADIGEWYTGQFVVQVPNITAQLQDASPELGTLLNCVHDGVPSQPTLTLNSISSSENGASILERCRREPNYSGCGHPPINGTLSCHYGGSKYSLSHAADLSVLGMSSSQIDDLKSAAQKCGGQLETNKSTNQNITDRYLHISTKVCRE